MTHIQDCSMVAYLYTMINVQQNIT